MAWQTHKQNLTTNIFRESKLHNVNRDILRILTIPAGALYLPGEEFGKHLMTIGVT